VATHSYHEPVLLTETLGQLDLAPGSVIIDGTLGGGGHAEAILERTAPDGILIGLDLDADAIREAARRLEPFGDRVHLVQASFRRIDDVAADLRASRGDVDIDGVLLDLGVSSHQLDAATRGFRFGPGDASPLDMRMDAEGGRRTAADLLATLSAEELERVFSEFGQLPGSRRLARAIVERRGSIPFETATDLLGLIREVGIGRGRRHNPATLVFQALRIAVNDELTALAEGLAAAVRVLRPGGRIAVIAYHSLEDRLVKQTFRAAARGCVCPPEFPVCRCGQKPSLEILTRRPIGPGDDEIARNPRARSARLRAAQRLEAA
jgi:16S rRNA (cytosine1402-N4)-methyltransferase